MAVIVHPTAIVADGARIGEGTTIGPYSIIGPDVVLGADNVIGPHVVIEGRTTLGSGNRIFQFSSIGAAPQDLKYKGEPSTLRIGDRNIIREFTTLQPGTAGDRMETVVGSGNLFMANSHLGHDCIVGNSNIIANSVAVAGHVTIDDGVIIGGLAGIHQFVHLGDLSFIAAGSMVSGDVPPFCLAQGDRARLVGLNQVGLRRKGEADDEIRALRAAYRALFLARGLMRERRSQVSAEFSGSKLVQRLMAFIEASNRGLIPAGRGRTSGEVSEEGE